MPNRKKEILNILNKAVKKADSRLELLHKVAADQHGIFQHFRSNVQDYATRDRYLAQRGGEKAPSGDSDSLYGVGPAHEDSKPKSFEENTSLSTRYSPDRVGVQALRIGDGIMQDPYTNKIYDYNEGFKTEDGRTFPGGSPSLQTSIMHLANHFDELGLRKESDLLDGLLEKVAEYSFIDNGAGAHADALTTEELGKLMDAGYPELRDVDRKTPWVRNALGLGPYEPAPGASRADRPLTTADFAKLFRAHENPDSTFKLDMNRLAQMTNANLTEEEGRIIDAQDGIQSTSSEDIKLLVSLATRLDRDGQTDGASLIDEALGRSI
jgi:hypothetical protein